MSSPEVRDGPGGDHPGGDRGGDARSVVLDGSDRASRTVPGRRRSRATTTPGFRPSTDIAALFVERVGDYRATVRRTRPPDLPSAIAAVLASHGAMRIVVPAGLPERGWPGSTSRPSGTTRRCRTASWTPSTGSSRPAPSRSPRPARSCSTRGPGQGRRVLSLLPDLHVCVVPAGRIVGSVPEALARLEPTRPLTWISGPSATSDIELQRVEGVHGPRRLEVIVLDEG